MSFDVDRCAVPHCRTTVSLNWSADSCPGGHVIVCGSCGWWDACRECAEKEGVA